MSCEEKEKLRIGKKGDREREHSKECSLGQYECDAGWPSFCWVRCSFWPTDTANTSYLAGSALKWSICAMYDKKGLVVECCTQLGKGDKPLRLVFTKFPSNQSPNNYNLIRVILNNIVIMLSGRSVLEASPFPPDLSSHSTFKSIFCSPSPFVAAC